MDCCDPAVTLLWPGRGDFSASGWLSPRLYIRLRRFGRGFLGFTLLFAVRCVFGGGISGDVSLDKALSYTADTVRKASPVKDAITLSSRIYLSQKSLRKVFPAARIFSGWCFGTFFIFPCIGNNNPKWRAYFSEGLKPPTRFHLIPDSLDDFETTADDFHGSYGSCRPLPKVWEFRSHWSGRVAASPP